jgi:hypothetical protein
MRLAAESTQPAPTVEPRRSIVATIGIVAVLVLWLAGVIFTTSRHEYWRDEVRAFTLARAASSPLNLYTLVQYDGHPAVWYLLLYFGISIVDTPLVLPVTSIAVAFAAVVLFMVWAPYPFWFRCLFIFTALVFYEYSVMARNYGVSILLLFVAAVLYPRRAEHPVLLAVALALLANTNVHSALFAALLAAVWAWDLVADDRKAARVRISRYLPLAIVGIGILICVAFTMPRERTILVVSRTLSPEEAVPAATEAVLRPDDTFQDLLPDWLPPKAAILLLYGAIVGLWRRPNLLLAALGAQLGLGVFFRAAYPGWYRHQGLYVVFLVFLYWVFLETTNRRRFLRGRGVLFAGGLAALLVLILVDVSKAPGVAWADITGEKSSSRAFGEFLRQSSEYRDAVIVPEPDFALESLPYYADNTIYLPRERRFSPTVSWTTDSRPQLTLGELLSAAQEVQSMSARPVLVVLGSMDPRRDQPGEVKYLYDKLFTWNAAELAAFRDATTFVVEFAALEGDEDYRVFALRQ